ncbi:MAG: hypothetical protein ACOYOU_09450 [Kiritimatiellia bacterium]
MHATTFHIVRPVTAALAMAVCLTGAGCRSTVTTVNEVQTRPETPDTPTTLMKELNYSVVVTPGDNDAKGIATRLTTTVNGQLAAAGYQLASATPDVVLRLSVKRELLDQSGNYYRYVGRVTASAESADGRTLNQETMVTKSERALGPDASDDAMATALAAQTATWISRACAPQQLRLAAAEVSVKRPFLSGDHPRFVTAFVKKVQAMKGVTSCRLVREDQHSGAFLFRVLYDQQVYPQGILNAVLLRLDEMRLER